MDVMEGEADWTESGVRFIAAFLDRDEDAGGILIDRLGNLRCVILLSSLLALVVREILGQQRSMEKISEYSRKIYPHLDPQPRRIVVERVMRTGAGHERSLTGLPTDEVLEVTVIVLRQMLREMGNDFDKADLADRAVQLSLNSTIID